MAAVVIISTSLLNTYVDKTVDQLCPVKFGTVGDADNHCAHFVCHVASISDKLKFGLTCDKMSNEGKKLNKNTGAGALIRVNEVYNNCEAIAEPDETGCLIYITRPGNFDKDGRMGTMPTKHIGIYFQGSVWHYSNKKDKVVCVPHDEFEKHYSGKTKMAYTKFPDGAKALTFDEVKALVN